MGFLSRLFGEEKQEQRVNAPGGDASDLYEYYEKKYERMRGEGKDVSIYSAEKARREGCPYPWATRAEEDYLCGKEHQVARGDLKSMLLLISAYENGRAEDENDGDYTIFQDVEKARYWQEYIINGAERGDRACQAALMTDMFMYGDKPIWKSGVSLQHWKDEYEEKLIADAEAGDAEAQYAVALFHIGDVEFGSEKCGFYFLSAGNAGISDGYFQYAEDFRLTKSLNEHKYVEYGKDADAVHYYLYIRKCADSNTGVFCGYAQYLIGKIYRDGDCTEPQDLNMSKKYFQMAIQNGYLLAELYI